MPHFDEPRPRSNRLAGRRRARLGIEDLHLLAVIGDFPLEISRQLLAGANPNQYDTEFRTPLEVAVLNNRYESAKVLLLYGAYPFGFGGRRASVIAHQASAPQLVTLLTAVEGVYRYIVLPTGRSQTLFREDPFIALRTLDPRFFVFLMNAFVYETARFNLGGEITPDQIKRNIMSHPAVQRLYDQVEDEEIPSSMYYVGR